MVIGTLLLEKEEIKCFTYFMKKLGFDLVLLGDNASGKETQANILKKKYEVKFVETGVYSRKLLQEKSRNGDWARKTVSKGKPLPVVLLKQFLVKEIKNRPKNKNFLFLGGPRLKPEAQLLKKILTASKKDFFVLYVTLSDKEVYRRSHLRKQKKNIKSIYKVLDDDNIIKERIKYYKNQVSKTVKYFQSLNKLTFINGNQSISKVAKDILEAVEKYKKTNTPA